MARKFQFLSIVLGITLAIGITTSMAGNINETEPNDTAGTANSITKYDVVSGTISTAGDVDYFSISGVNTQWGFIAFLDTSGSDSSTDGVLTVYGSDGSTVLQTDNGSWANGSVIAWQNYASGSGQHYIRVSESGDDDTVTPYSLKYYSIAMSTQDEVEPNDTPASGTIFAKVNQGKLDNPGDVDCYRFYGKSGNDFLFALNADPENDGSATNFAMTVYSTTGSVMGSVDFSGVGGNEIVENVVLPDDGIYALCVNASGGVTDSTATYLVGPLRNGLNYLPSYDENPTWLNPPGPDEHAKVGDILEFELVFTNTTPITLPQQTAMYGYIDPYCLSFVSTPGATYSSTSQVRWEFTDIPPESVITATFTTQAMNACSDDMHQGVSMYYYSWGVGESIYYDVFADVFLPLVVR